MIWPEAGDEERALRATVGELAGAFGHHRYAACAAQGQFPTDLWSSLAAGGFVGVNVPELYGGGGGTLRDLTIVAEEVAAQGCPLMTLVVSPAICAPILQRFGTDAQRGRWLPGIGRGTSRMAFAITEPDAGSNTHRTSTRAVIDRDWWVLRGQKYYISGADEADNIMVVARTGQTHHGRSRLSLFVVPADSPGLILAPIPTQVRAAERQFTVTLESVRVGAENLIGEAGDGLTQLFEGLNPERIMSAATCVGLGRYALRKAAHYAKTRSVWGVPIGAHQAIAHPLARALVSVEAATLMLRRAVELHESGAECGSAANMAKFAAAEAAQEALDAAIQTHGGNGMSDEYGLADLWGITRLYGIAPVSREMTLNHLATHELGLPKSY